MTTPAEIIESIAPKYKKGPAKEYYLMYNSTSQTLEPLYFWIKDFMDKLFGGDVEKLIDNFTSSPGSGHFSELSQKATIMRDEAMKIYGMVNTVIKSIINIIYDLKEFKLRMKNYEDAKSSDKTTKQAGLLSLKQIWMDSVDIKRGRGSINMMAQDLSFVTLRDAFMAVDSLKAVKDLDLNERVQRVLKARLQEFLEWKDRSEIELNKRFEIEKTYLKTQVSTLKMYSRWAKPYLIAAEKLRMSEESKYNADLVSIFNTLFLQLTLLGKSPIKTQEAAVSKNLPEDFKKIKFKRKYYSCVLVDFKFRGIPQKAGQHYVFGGRADVTFKSYALNDQELALLKKKLDASDFDDSLKLVEGMTDETLGQLKLDIEEFLGEIPEEKQKKEKSEKDINPFAALLGLEKKPKKEKTKEKSEEEKLDKEYKEKYGFSKKQIDVFEKAIKKDNYAEGLVRKLAEDGAKGTCYTIYDIYKKGHGMASTPDKV